MSPIAPRYRGPNASSDASQPALSPILTIPNLASKEDEGLAYSGVSDESSSESPDTEVGSQETQVKPVVAEGSGIRLGGMQESIRRITDTATQSLKQVGTDRSFNPVETVRGVLPGIVISISIICLWWIIGRSSPAPLRNDVARDPQNSQQTIDPIASDPLRAKQRIDVAADENRHPEAETNRDGQLFDHVPFINRPTNEAVSQSDATQEVPSTVPPSNEEPQAGTRPAASGPGFPQATQNGIANSEANSASARDEADLRRTNNAIEQRPVGVADRSTEFEWKRGNSVQRRADPGQDRGMAQRHNRQVTAEQSDRDRPFDDRQPQRTFSYQQTDPSTYKDPIYNVPPVARRAQPARR